MTTDNGEGVITENEELQGSDVAWEIYYRDFGSDSSSQLDQSVCSCYISVIRLTISSLEWNRRTTEEKQGGKMKLDFSSPVVQPSQSCKFSEKASTSFTRVEKYFKHRGQQKQCKTLQS